MIDAALSLLAGQLNQHLRRAFQADEDLVVLSSLQEPDGSAVPLITNKVVLFLVGIERDPTAQRAPETSGLDGASQFQMYPPVYLNLLVMCAANFSGASYLEALKFLSGAITFLQGKPVMDHSNTPEMHPRIERLMFSIENLGTNDLHGLWGINGGRYLPSVLYRVRLLSMDSRQIAGRQAPIVELALGVQA